MAKVMKVKKSAPANWQEALQLYLGFKGAQGLRPITVKGHGDVVGLFYRRHPEAWNGQVREGVYAFMGEAIKPATYNIRRNYLRQYFAWAVEERIVDVDPMAKLKKRRDEGRTTVLDEDTVRKLLILPDKSTFAGLRDYALICFFMDTGARPNEAFSLGIHDIDLKAKEARIASGVSKTGVSRTLPISTITAQAIANLIQSRHHMWKNNVTVFCSAEGTPMRNDTWGDRLEVYAKLLGVKFHPYALRHTFATLFLRGGGNALALQRLMGHSTLDMTKRYVHLSQADVKSQHEMASPLKMIFGALRVGRIR